MKPDIKKKWVEALRSGKYVRGRFSLKNRLDENFTTHCCLGVLCEIMNEIGEIPDLSINERSVLFAKVYCTSIPEYVCDKIGLPMFAQKKLIDMNDSHDKNFNQIADYIEENL